MQPTYTVPSRTHPGTRYALSVDALGRFTCPCKGFEYRRSCWHVNAAEAGVILPRVHGRFVRRPR